MGKVKRSKGSKLELEKAKRQTPLAKQILEDDSVRPTGRTKQRQRNEDDEEYVEERLSRKILEQARSQQEELESEHGISAPGRSKLGKKTEGKVRRTTSLGKPTDGSSDEASDDDEEEMAGSEEIYDKFEVNEEDEKALEMFLSHNPPVRRTLADIIQEKITEKKTEIQTQFSDNASVVMQQLDDRVVNMYKSIGMILRKYRSGKLPKAFKIIPALNNWEQILYLTDPEGWSAAAVYQATRIFASNLNAKMAQRFFNLVLLPRIRDDITEFKRLNFHLFMALRKALFKPAAFFKGILLPLCESGTCVLREAIIIASVLLKNSIPMLHSAAAILKIAEMEYNGANSIFLRSLLDKKYALPYRVIDAVVFHFLRFQQDKRDLPVLWHQSLLTFVQRYKEDMSSEQKEALVELLRAHTHHQITAEVRRELIHSRCRGDVEGGKGEMEIEGDG